MIGSHALDRDICVIDFARYASGNSLADHLGRRPHPPCFGQIRDFAILDREDPVSIGPRRKRSEEHTSELQSLMRISYAVFCLKKQNKEYTITNQTNE